MHDIGYLKISKGVGHCRAGSIMSRKILNNIKFSQDKINKVCDTVLHHEDFKFGIKNHKPSIETKIVQDADLIDSFGVVGIALFLCLLGIIISHCGNLNIKKSQK